MRGTSEGSEGDDQVPSVKFKACTACTGEGDEKQRWKKEKIKTKEDEDQGGRELINWLKDTHILFSVMLSGGQSDVTWRRGGRLQGLGKSDMAATYPKQGIALIGPQRW